MRSAALRSGPRAIVTGACGAAERLPGLRFTDYSAETVAQCIESLGQVSPAVLSAERPVLRVADQSPPPPRGSPDRDCRIKGNISKHGRIYHVPGSRWYDETKIDTSKGERWFCSEQEAIDAGWRAPR